MKVILSSTYDNLYLFNLPIVTWAWAKLGVETVCFLPELTSIPDLKKFDLVMSNLPLIGIWCFKCPPEKTATYAQVSRLFACCLNLPEDEVLITSDVDMMVFKAPLVCAYDRITIFGSDLTPKKQFPMCYASGTVKDWRSMLEFKNESYQEMLDEHVGTLEAEHFRGNFWSRDQELLYNYVSGVPHLEITRARPGTQFADNRLDRDDAYILEHLSPDIVDYHMHRPLWEESNFQKLMTIMQYFWPEEDFTWVREYREKYIALL